MTRKLKALGLALVAVFAFGALSAAGASAASFHSEIEPTVLTGTSEEGKDVFSASGFTIECHGSFSGTALTKTTTELTLHPTYTECSSPQIGIKGVDTTGCWYVFGATTNGTGHLPVSVGCTEGVAGIKITAEGCTMTFGPQTVSGGVKATNLGSGSTRDVTADVTASNVTFSKSGLGCFIISGDTGTYTAKTTLKGFVDGGLLSGQTDEHPVWNEGAQVGIWWE